ASDRRRRNDRGRRFLHHQASWVVRVHRAGCLVSNLGFWLSPRSQKLSRGCCFLQSRRCADPAGGVSWAHCTLCGRVPATANSGQGRACFAFRVEEVLAPVYLSTDPPNPYGIALSV